MANQLVGFLERALVQQQVDAFACGKLAFLVLARLALGTTTSFGPGVTARMTSGPVMNIWLVASTMKMKSVMAGE